MRANRRDIRFIPRLKPGAFSKEFGKISVDFPVVYIGQQLRRIVRFSLLSANRSLHIKIARKCGSGISRSKFAVEGAQLKQQGHGCQQQGATQRLGVYFAALGAQL